MKTIKILSALALLAMTAVTAQKKGPHGERGEYHSKLTVEQLATLKTKKMTLALDLTPKQQDQVFEFNKVNAQYHKEKRAERMAKKSAAEKTKPSAAQRYQMANARLDHKIAQQQKLKEILTEEQFDQWRSLQQQRHAKKNRRPKSRKG